MLTKPVSADFFFLNRVGGLHFADSCGVIMICFMEQILVLRGRVVEALNHEPVAGCISKYVPTKVFVNFVSPRFFFFFFLILKWAGERVLQSGEEFWAS